MTDKSKCEEKVIYRYSENLKRQIVSEVESGTLTVSEAKEYYGVANRRTINRWLWKYGERQVKTRVVRVLMKDEQRRIRELEKALADERLKRELYAAQLKRYAQEVPDLKKRLSTEQLRTFEENEKRIEAMD